MTSLLLPSSYRYFNGIIASYWFDANNMKSLLLHCIPSWNRFDIVLVAVIVMCRTLQCYLNRFIRKGVTYVEVNIIVSLNIHIIMMLWLLRIFLVCYSRPLWVYVHINDRKRTRKKQFPYRFLLEPGFCANFLCCF